MNDINEDEVVHIDLIGKRKVYSEAAYNKVCNERDQLRRAIERHRNTYIGSEPTVHNEDWWLYQTLEEIMSSTPLE